MTEQKRLPVLKANATKLGRATIMDRSLAQRYGVAYVHLAAFAIDVDRVHRVVGDDPSLPFGWEVALTEARLVRFLDEATSEPSALLEDMCLSVMDLATRESAGVLGGQLPFAIYTGVAHRSLPPSLGGCFRVWKKPPVHLIQDVAEVLARENSLAALATTCLGTRLDPPLIEPVRVALQAFGSTQTEGA